MIVSLMNGFKLKAINRSLKVNVWNRKRNDL